MSSIEIMKRQIDIIHEIKQSTERIEAYAVEQPVLDRKFPLSKNRHFRFINDFFAVDNTFARATEAGFSKIQAWYRNQLLKEPGKLLFSAAFNKPVTADYQDPKKSNQKSKAR